MNDYLVRAVSEDGAIKAVAITSKNLVQRARDIHHCLPLATAALGRTLTAASMMGNMLKEEKGALTLQVKGDGPLGTIVTVSDSEGNVRGYLQNPGVELPLTERGKLDVGGGVGVGQLVVIKDLGLKEPFTGMTELVGGEIAEDIAAYFAESEQVPTACALGVLVDRDLSVKAAGGYLIQLLPGAGDEVVDRVEKGVLSAGPITAMLDRGSTPEEILNKVLSGFALHLAAPEKVEYRCQCSRDKVVRALLSMGRKELSSMAEEQPETEVTCQFCDKIYHFSREDLLDILKLAK